MLVFPFAEQRPLCDSANFDLGFGEVVVYRLDFPGGLYANNTLLWISLSIYLCPSGGGGDAPIDLGYDSAEVAESPGQYLGSAEWMDIARSSIVATGVLYPNSRVACGDITDGTSATLMICERSRNLADAAWSGVFGSRSESGPLCTKRGRHVESCVGHMFLLMGRTGPSADILSGSIPSGNTPNHPGEGADGFSSRHPGGCEFLFCDGSVRFLKAAIAPQVFQALASRAGEQVVVADFY